MKKVIRFLFFLMVLASAKMVEAQSFEVAFMTEDEGLIVQAETDENDKPCAKFLINLGNIPSSYLKSFKVESEDLNYYAWIDAKGYERGQIWVWVTEGIEALAIYNMEWGKQTIVPKDLGIERVEPYRSYSIELKSTKPVAVQSTQSGNTSGNVQYVIFRVVPKEVNPALFVDGMFLPLNDDGRAHVRLTEGKHGYTVSAKDYHPITDSIEVGKVKLEVPVSLKPAFGWLKIKDLSEDENRMLHDSETVITLLNRNSIQSQQITIDELTKGNGKKLSSGNYDLYFVNDNLFEYYPLTSVNIHDGGVASIPIKLTPYTGSLDLSSDPDEAAIYIDNRKEGETPNIIVLNVGKHRVRLEKDGYEVLERDFEIVKDEILKLPLTLMKIQAQTEPDELSFILENEEVAPAEPAPTPTVTETPKVEENVQPKNKTPQPTYDIEVDFSYFECQVEGTGSYEKGETCTLTVEVSKEGKAFSCWKEGNKVVSSASSYSFEVAGKRKLIAECVDVPEGAVRGLFSVNEEQDTMVWFAQGNLQYQASTNSWRIAAHQYDCIGSFNDSVMSETDDGWIDLFGWGTGNNPTFNSTKNDDYGAFVDWGGNSISIGETRQNSGAWRTLSSDEWFHIISDRQTESGLRYAKARVEDVNGVILLPDNWNRANYSFNRPNESNAPYGSNVISLSEWNSIFEAKGAVFLPAAGFRICDKQADYVNKTYDVGNSGRYWSSEKVFADSEHAKSLQISDTGCSTGGEERSDEISVRLVCRQTVYHNKTGKTNKPQKTVKPRKP